MKRYIAVFLILAAAVSYGLYASKRTVNIVFTGDILLARDVGKAIAENGYDYPYTDVKRIIKAADIAFGNLECPLTKGGTPSLKRSYLLFRADPDNAAALKKAGYDVLNLANNHTMDYGHDGLLDTIDILKKAGIEYVGAGNDKQEEYKPVVINRKGIKIGILSFSDFPPEGYIYSENKSDIARTDEKMIKKSIEDTKKICEFLIVSFHWGNEFSFYPAQMQKEYAHEAVDSGADLVVGHHPHVLQSIEKYKDKYVFYSLGNFVFDRQIYKGTDDTAILSVKIDKKGFKQACMIPVKIKNCKPYAAYGEEALKIAKDILEYSKNKGADISISRNNEVLIQK